MLQFASQPGVTEPTCSEAKERARGVGFWALQAYT
jgi:hypothetical protein